jgi:hypothetical protein
VTTAERYYRSAAAGPTVTPAKAFHRDGPVFRHDDGTIFPWLFGSEFPTLRMWMDDKAKLPPLYADRYAVGQRGFSFFVTSEDPSNLLPGPYSDREVLDAIGPFVDELQAHGFNAEACVCNAVSVTMPQRDRQAAYWNAACDIARVRPFMSISLSKEAFKQVGVLDVDHLRRPTGQTWDGGATRDGVDYPAIARAGSHFTFQAPRTDDWPRKTKSGWDVSQMFPGYGCVTVEPMGADETDQPGRRSNVADDFFWSAANSRLLSMGSYFHSQAGATGALFGPNQRACAVSHFAALNLIPCESQLGRYAKAVPGGFGVATLDDACLRTYGCLLSNTDQWDVVTRPAGNYPRNGALIDPAAANGWTIAERHGPQGTVLRCVR